MATPFVPGPAPVWVAPLAAGAAGGATPFFLGFSERGVSIQLTPTWKPYYNDLGGETPLDYSYQGQSATFSLDLTRWNPDVLMSLEDYVSGNQFANSAEGIDGPGEMGSLASYEGTAFVCWIRFPYAVSVPYAGHTLGYRFPRCIIENESLPERGSKPAKVHLNCRAIRFLDMSASTLNAFGAGELTLYDFDMSAVAGLLPD